MITMTDANMTTLTMIKEIIKVELLCKSSHICLKSNRFEDLTMMQCGLGFNLKQMRIRGERWTLVACCRHLRQIVKGFKDFKIL